MFILTGSASRKELNWSETLAPQSATPTVGRLFSLLPEIYTLNNYWVRQVISDAWRRCQFRDEGTVESEAADGAGGVTVTDRASGETLGVYSCAGSGSGAEALGMLQPAETCP